MKNVHLHTLGFPRIGAQRELKFALERYWRGDAPLAELEATGRELRARHWALQAEAGLDFVSVGDFAFYDQVLNHIQLFGCAPARFGFGAAAASAAEDLDQAFTMARGATAAAPAGAAAACGCGAGHEEESHGAALEMTKWFDTNYHYLVPEFDAATTFTLVPQRLLAEVAEARALGHCAKVALIGPLTFLWLGKMSATAPADRLALLERLLPVYTQLLGELQRTGAQWVQIDEPILGLDLPPAWRNAFEPAYWQLSQSGAQIMLATYFSPLEENLSLACRLPVAGLHVDGVLAPHELASVADWLPVPKVLSVGIVDGRNVWRTDLHAALATLEPLLAKRQGDLWLAPSCSLLHVPYSLQHETRLDAELRGWLACATEKLAELSALRAALLDPAVATAAQPTAGDVPRAAQHGLFPQSATGATSHREHTGDVPQFAEHEHSPPPALSTAEESSGNPPARQHVHSAALAGSATLHAAHAGDVPRFGEHGHSRQTAAAHAFAASAAALASRGRSVRVHDDAVQAACTQATADPRAQRRSAPFAERAAAQQARLNLPTFPTTTIGSFPQTPAIRAARAAHRRGELSASAYQHAMRAEIAHVIRRQEQLGLDVLVHGEAERNDMVEYFGEQLDGFAFTEHGWVQSYGSRCVKPPIIYGDVGRPHAMTVAWARFAQQLTNKPVKGMLTGPITLLQWSFVRADQPRSRTALQLALALRAEVADLEQAGIAIIQVDEPALREGLPLRRARQPDYLDWATRAFRLATGGAAAGTQIHTHMCYAEFGDILPAIAALDADVITIEASRSGLTLLGDLQRFRYPNAVGPGVFDIHSPRVPAAATIAGLLRSASSALDVRQLWVNPDCGLKTRAWPETEAALQNMVAAARQLRAEYTNCPN